MDKGCNIEWLNAYWLRGAPRTHGPELTAVQKQLRIVDK